MEVKNSIVCKEDYSRVFPTSNTHQRNTPRANHLTPSQSTSRLALFPFACSNLHYAQSLYQVRLAEPAEALDPKKERVGNGGP